MAHEPLTQEEVLLEGFLDLGTPEGFRAELIEEEIVVTGPPDGEHEDYISLIVEQVLAQSATRMQFSGHKGLRAPRGGLYVRNHVTPDGTFAPRQLRLFRGAESWMPCEGVSMIVKSSVTLFSDPEKADYREVVTVPFGKPIDLPAPFSFTLETADFL